MDPSANSTGATPTAQDSRERDPGMRALLAGLGANGLIFFLLLVVGGAAVLRQFELYALGVVLPAASGSTTKISILSLLRSAIQIAAWLPMLPLLLVAIFLPLRLAWIHGQVTWRALGANTVDSLRRTLHTLQFTWRQLLFLMAPIIGLLVFLRELKATGQPLELEIFIQCALAAFGLAALWQVTATLCAPPIAILAQCAPYAAARSCQQVMRGYHRLRVLCSLLICASVVLGLATVSNTGTLSGWCQWPVLAAAAVGLWLMLINIGKSCLVATATHIEHLESMEKQVLAHHAAQLNLNGIVTTLPNGETVTIQIQPIQNQPVDRESYR